MLSARYRLPALLALSRPSSSAASQGHPFFKTSSHLLRGLSEGGLVFGLEHCLVSFRHHHPHNLHNPQIHKPTILLHIISLLPSVILILIIQ